MQSTINWNEVRKRAIDLGLRSDRSISTAAGIHRNSFGSEAPYKSSTLDALAILLRCDPKDLIDWAKAPDKEPA